MAGLDGEEFASDAILRFIVGFQHTYSLRRMVEVEPEHVIYQMTRVMPIMRARLLPHFPGPDGFIVANVVTRVALSHALIPDDDPELFYAELRHAAGLDQRHPSKTRHRHRPVRPTSEENCPMNQKRHQGRSPRGSWSLTRCFGSPGASST